MTGPVVTGPLSWYEIRDAEGHVLLATEDHAEARDRYLERRAASEAVYLLAISRIGVVLPHDNEPEVH